MFPWWPLTHVQNQGQNNGTHVSDIHPASHCYLTLNGILTGRNNYPNSRAEDTRKLKLFAQGHIAGI